MAININNLGNASQIAKQKVEQQTQVKQQVAQTAVKSEQSKQLGQDSISLTPQAKQLRELQKKANDAPTLDLKKIEQLKKAISSGEYKVDAEKLAQNMSNYELDLP